MRFDVFNHGEEKHAPLSFVQSTNGLITLDSQLLRQSRHLRGGKYLSDRFSERQPRAFSRRYLGFFLDTLTFGSFRSQKESSLPLRSIGDREPSRRMDDLLPQGIRYPQFALIV